MCQDPLMAQVSLVSSSSSHREARGYAYMRDSSLCFALLGALVKLASATLSIDEIPSSGFAWYSSASGC